MHYRSTADAVKLNRYTDENEREIIAVQPQHHTKHTSSNSNNMNTTLYVIENVSEIPKHIKTVSELMNNHNTFN